MEWAQREREIEIEEKTWRGDQKREGRKKREKREGRKKREKREKKEEMRVYLNPEGRGLSCFEEEFRRI